MSAAWGIHWFRRDLRVAGNAALQWNWHQHRGRVLGLFCFDPAFLARPDFSTNRFGFFLQTLQALREELQRLGGSLLVLDHGPRKAFQQLLHWVLHAGHPLPSVVSFNRDYEPFARQRDSDLSGWLPGEFGIPVYVTRDHLLIEPWELTRDDGSFYQVYTPFARRWRGLLQYASFQQRLSELRPGLQYLRQWAQGRPSRRVFRLTWHDVLGEKAQQEDQLATYRERILQQVTVPLPPAGSLAAWQRWQEFKHHTLPHYHRLRDRPDIAGTSRLSLYFKNGSLTVPLVLADLLASPPAESSGATEKFISELIWREFYYHILYHRPDVEQHAFLTKYDHLPWPNREDWFERWTQGLTGYPIVDAGMRELLSTGWMHNRVRMIVASFLTKDLLIDWRWGERYFMQMLLDGDLAPNNGGWQWAASTGCDPQPYFRIFNPVLQAQKFDPQGEYIRRYLPELRDVPVEHIHEPHRWGRTLAYPPPLVDHTQQRASAIELYRRAAQ
ncbi:MAG: deoxyribodipyrimidine photo-lyase [Planctomycetaceae bacterium]|nr:MAG: deoxyribodipyrimidine photo-lyase [Planctomycetaceae bacterium]